ncbi:hypothetical protein QBC35DRAFT_118567 [Podospora australis]|uniref:Small ribosomal subunit protein uS5m n=1 Tax=Podospora australis TaxID=1536484 RepID=A0AAN6WXK0_9PEZI|nr:hypothetical protein QBC35DRAFT_118567 [Podospora australis]
MSLARPVARRLVASSSSSSQIISTPCHQLLGSSSKREFHSTPQLEARRKNRPRFSNVRAAEMGLVDEEKIKQFSKQKFPKYTKEEMVELQKRYSPQQIEALKAGEAAINPRDLTIQGRLRVDPYKMPYIDDFAESQPIIDKRPQNRAPPDPKANWMGLDEFTADLIKWADQFQTGEVTGTMKKVVDFVPEEWKKIAEARWPGEVRDEAHKQFKKYLQAEVDRSEKEQKAKREGRSLEEDTSGPTDGDVLQYILERSVMTDNGLVSNSSVAPALPDKVPGVAGMGYKAAVDPEDQGLDDNGIYQEVKRVTGMSVKDLLALRTRRIWENRVSNQTRLGKIPSFYTMVVAGNKNGWLGLGVVKSADPSVSFEKARLQALRNLKPIPRYENRTIYGNVSAKFGAAVVELSTRPPGFGLRVQHRIFELCRAAGIYDLAARVPRGRNPMNVVKATYEALLTQKNPETIAIGRGKKLVDVRKVYYSGAPIPELGQTQHEERRF